MKRHDISISLLGYDMITIMKLITGCLTWFYILNTHSLEHSQWLPHRHGTLYHNTFGTRPLFSSSAENWRPFCSGRRSLTLHDNVLCFICSPVVRCWSVTMYWLLQTDFVDTVWWSCSSSAIVPPKSYSFLLLLLPTTNCCHPLSRRVMILENSCIPDRFQTAVFT